MRNEESVGRASQLVVEAGQALEALEPRPKARVRAEAEEFDVLVIGGGVLGFIPKLPQLEFDPELILVLVLPPILYQAALLTSWRDFKVNIRPIGLLAIGLVIATTLAVGAAFKLLVPDCPWAVAFVLGAIVSPPDAVAATAILSRLNIPRRVVTILEGESLVNDASGLVIYKFAVAAVIVRAPSRIT